MKQIKFFRAWAIFFVAAFFLGFFLGAVCGGILGLVCNAMGIPLEEYALLLSAISWISGAIPSYFCFVWAVKKYLIPQVVKQVEHDSALKEGFRSF